MLSYILLPSTVTPVERAYLERSHRVGLATLWAHLPVFLLVAWANGTGVASAALLTVLALAGPTVASVTLTRIRWVSIVQGIAAMCLGGVLVHLGQGPYQIEMHFYFFSVLALLTIFGNPMVILAAAATVVVHHTVIWWLFPASVFNYDATVFVIGVHAVFVVLESVGAIYLARSYFDNVIGLEQIVAERTVEVRRSNAALKMVMTHVDQGLLTLDAEGRISTERSAAVDRWLGEVPEGATFAAKLGEVDAGAGSWFDIAWPDVISGFLPREVTLGQLPTEVKHADGRVLGLRYVPIAEEGEQQVLVVLSDRTAEVEQRAAEARRLEVLHLLEQFMKDRSGFLDFLEDARALMDGLQVSADADETFRLLHTLKGNAACFGLERFSQVVHGLESVVMADRRVCRPEEVQGLHLEWASVEEAVAMLTGAQDGRRLELTEEEYQRLERAVRDNAPRVHVLRLVRSIPMQPARVRLQRVAEQSERIAERLGIEGLRVVIDDHDVRLHPEAWGPFWASFVHVVRNAIDHGLEDPYERVEAGKTEHGTLRLSVRRTGDEVEVACADDGRGVDWERVAAKAREKGLPAGSHEDLVAALFASGMSTRDEVTELSGRGVGMGAVKQAVDAMGGRIEITSRPGEGTTVCFRIPRPDPLERAA